MDTSKKIGLGVGIGVFLFIVLFLISFLLAFFILAPSTGKIIENDKSQVEMQNSLEREYYNVTSVIDGDTFYIDTGEKVRLICIDSPEKGEKMYLEAKRYLEDLILYKKVKLEKDISDKDRYNRLLRYVYSEDGSFINELIVYDGYAFAYPYSPDITLCSIINNAEEQAKGNELGVWHKIIEEPEDFDETVSPFEPCSCTEDLDCPDFDTHAEAQACFDYCGGVENDVHRLDRDKDGLACESLG